MGSIESVHRSLDSAIEKESATRAAMDISIKLIQSRFESFESNLKKEGPYIKVPGAYLAQVKKILTANISQGTYQNRDAIQGIVSDFSSGRSAQRIVYTLFVKFDEILSQFNVAYSELVDYILVADLIGGIYRIDFAIINQKLQNPGFSDKISSVFGAQVIVSTVNREDVKDDTVFKLLIERQFGDQSYQTKAVIFKLLKGEQLNQEQVQLLEKITEKQLRLSEN